MGLDLSYYEALLGGAGEETGEAGGGAWVVSPDGAVSDGLLRLVGKARVVADALSTQVYVLAGGGVAKDAAQPVIRAGADRVFTAAGAPGVDDLAEFFRERNPQLILFPRSLEGRMLGSGLAQALGGSLCGYAADLAVDPVYQRIVAHQPVLEDAARQAVALLRAPALAVMETALLPAAVQENWRTGEVEDTGLVWPAPPVYATSPRPPAPVTLQTAGVVVAAGRGLGPDAAGFELAERLAQALGGAIGGDLGALDAGWIAEDQLIGLTGHSIAPRLLLAFGIDGDTSFFMATQGAGLIVAVQPDAGAPIVPVADYNVIAEPAAFAEALLAALESG